MSTIVSPRRRSSRLARRNHTRPAEARQESLFGALPAAPERPAPTAPEPAPVEVEVEAAAPIAPPEPSAGAETADLSATETARAHRQGPTLDDLVAGAWEGLLAGAPAGCPVCETTLAPRYSASGIVGGRCGGCGSTLG